LQNNANILVLNDARRKSTGAKLYSRPSTLKSTEVNVSIAPMELAPMLSSVTFSFLARDVIYTSRTYATMSVSVCPSVNLSVTEVHWHIIANLGFKFRSQFTAQYSCGACGHEGRDHHREEWRDHLALW